jgi:gliding motility-associated protein GldM
MALPREPRQKMINIMYLVLTAILALNVSNEVINAFKVVDKSLMTSNVNLSIANNGMYDALKQKLTEGESRDKAAIWQPKAEQAKGLSESLYNYLESLKGDIKTASGNRKKWDEEKKDSVDDFKEDNLDAATRVMDVGKKGDELKEKLEAYKNALLNIDPKIKAKFENSLQFDTDTREFKTREGQVKDFTQTYFHMTPTVAALTMLSKFQNNVKNAENKVVAYCLSQVGSVELVYNKFKPIATTNSTYIMPGGEITMTAGVGAFNDQAAPVISFDGAVTPLNAEGVAEKKFTASGAGLHKTHVHIAYKDPNTGLPAVLDKDIEYTVGTPGGSAVMLDKMNVFYIGVDNPVTINSGTGWDKTNVSMEGGTINKTSVPGKFIVKVEKPGKAVIHITADKAASNFEFRVKMIPDPVFMVGPSKGGRVQSVVIKNQQYCRAELENFDFEARFTVVSATVYFSGANFSNVQTVTLQGNNLGPISSYMQRAIPGSSITFDNVKVQGPDGRVRTILGPSFTLW